MAVADDGERPQHRRLVLFLFETCNLSDPAPLRRKPESFAAVTAARPIAREIDSVADDRDARFGETCAMNEEVAGHLADGDDLVTKEGERPQTTARPRAL